MPSCNYEGVQYSEGALICANGRELKCSGGEWHETGYQCNTTKAASEIHEISEAERAIYANSSKKPKHVPGGKTVYAEFFSIRHDNNRFYYFRAGLSPEHICSKADDCNDYQVPFLDVKYIGPQTACPAGQGWYRAITFIWPTS